MKLFVAKVLDLNSSLQCTSLTDSFEVRLCVICLLEMMAESLNYRNSYFHVLHVCYFLCIFDWPHHMHVLYMYTCIVHVLTVESV